MVKVKMDLSRVKQFLFEKGERVGLIACLGIMVVVVGYSLYSGFSARGTERGEPWPEAITKAAKSTEQQVLNAQPGEPPPPLDPSFANWPPIISTFSWLSLFPLPDKAFTKKLNPTLLSLLPPDGEKHFQLDYIRAGYFHYDIDIKSQKAQVISGGGGGGMQGGMQGGMPAAMVGKGVANAGGSGGITSLKRTVGATRMVVVSGLFPIKDQLEEFRKALRYADVGELLAHRDELPRPLGLEVARIEYIGDGKWSKDPYHIFKFDTRGNGKLEHVAQPIKDMMRHMLIDEDNPQSAPNYIFSGLVTPLPKLANAKYPKLDLRGIDIKEEVAAAEEKNPMGKGPIGFAMPNMKKGIEQPAMAAAGGGDVQWRPELWTKLSKELQDKFKEKYFMFDPLGQPQTAPSTDKKAANASTTPPMGMQGQMGGAVSAAFGWDAILGAFAGGGPMQTPMGKMGEEAGEGEPKTVQQNVQLPENALVRFFDPTVRPGKTYIYYIRVRMANPNYQKKTEVAYQQLADLKEIQYANPATQGWTITPPITIPGDYYWYAAEQMPEVKIKGGSDYGPLRPGYKPELAPVQVHRWVDKASDANEPYTLADWAIAERLLTRRGEPIGRPGVMIEVPRWSDRSQSFIIASSVQAARGKPKTSKEKEKSSEPIASGIPIDTTFQPPPPFLMVDFEGGVKNGFDRRDGSREFLTDSSAFEVLALTPDGRLIARNSRLDVDPETPPGSERTDRVEQWRKRLEEVRDNGSGGASGGFQMPMGPMGGLSGSK